MADPAERRLWLLSLLRLAGYLLALTGLGVAAASRGDAVLVAAGLVVAAIGGVASLVLPRLLVRQWRR